MPKGRPDRWPRGRRAPLGTAEGNAAAAEANENLNESEAASEVESVSSACAASVSE